MILRDPVHHLISFSGESERLLVKLIDTPEMQRLRRIRALGLACFAFPGGEHSRFAHAVGSAHVMGRYLDRVRALSGELAKRDQISPETELIALAAALLHDLGHGPYSHTFEDLVPGASAHETWTTKIVLDPDTQVHAVLNELDPAAPHQVAELIGGRSPIPHLARAVSGTFDVDRCDYLMRDSYMTGVRYGLLDVDWLLASLRLHRPPDAGAASLAVDGEKGLTAVEGFFLARLYMYRQVYRHKAVRAAEGVIQALFRRLARMDPQPETPPALATLLSANELSTADYLALDDHVLEVALASWEQNPDPILSELAGRLRGRRLFKTLSLRADADPEAALSALRDTVAKAGFDPQYFASIDWVEIDAYTDDESLVVLHPGGRVQRLIDASPVLRGLSREQFVHRRAVFPEQARESVRARLAEFT